MQLKRRLGRLPASAERGVRSFYDHLHDPEPTHCTGTSCWAARGGTLGTPGIRCLGRCYEPPASTRVPASEMPASCLSDEPILFRTILGDADPWAEFDLPDGPTILARVLDAGLRGRGGAAYPTAAKWTTARDTHAIDRVVVANGDEGDPGAYVDRILLERAPHGVLAGMLACARVIGAGTGIVYIRGEYPDAPARVQAVLDEARKRGLLDGFDVRIARGHGSYVAGEETALLRSIEGLRAEPFPKPPYPAVRGLGGLPTVVQNVETLAMVPWITRHGVADRKGFCMSGCVREPQVVEAPLGTTIQTLIDACGGTTQQPRMALVGGPMGRVVAARSFDVRLDFESLPGMGHGGIVVLDERISPRALAEHLFDFAAAESCGNCAPCRIGTAQLAHVRDRASFERLASTMEMGSLCGFGSGVPKPLRDLLEIFGDEVLAC